MTTKNTLYLFIFLLSILTASCSKNEFEEPQTEAVEPEEETTELQITQLVIPTDFDFATQQNITVTINDASPYVRYDLYAYNDTDEESEEVTFENEIGETVTGTEWQFDLLNRLVFSAVPYNGKIEKQIVLPTYYTKVYIRRKEQNKYSSEVVSVVNNRIDYTHVNSSGKTAKAGVTDYLYCVNGGGELFQVDPLDGSYTPLSTMPMGSYTAAIDQENKVLYSIGKSSPYPLMKYDIATEEWSTVNDLGYGGPRLAYNDEDRLLYFSDNSGILKIIDPIEGVTLSSWEITGLDNTGGGDLAFDPEGTIFMCTFSGLYELALTDDSYYSATRISADNLPFNPTSMTFDSNDELWLATSSSDSDLIIMDTQTGGWEYRYGVNATGSEPIGRAINDLATFRVFSEDDKLVDTDGDGIVDGDDEFPDDADKAFESYTPSKYGNGTLAFEDLWPFQGDYDFNDVAVNYKVIAVENAANEVVQVNFEITSKANGAGFTNAFGIEFENLSPSIIASVTGQVLNEGYIDLNANGTEADQENAVVIFYDNNYSVLKQDLVISIKFTEPIESGKLGTAPFNPFIIVDKDREVEVHLPYAKPTSLAKNSEVIEGNNKDTDKNYVTDTGLPWAINVVHDFKVPTEKTAVNKAYNHFDTWATSGGVDKADWYKDSAGYRNTSKLAD
ncbi:LruC domain-containing protein [Maribacter luteus]|uniref:LruC domain-containing protein n=1 Tax=Maribacter luteus TaxID=2594478 RepID=A0A6I2MQ48_9FLAO|nr:LruC domain-containing protein [Maribacter luteus]MRX64655.1 LruC domain-containing protein [Maribacter luteus]